KIDQFNEFLQTFSKSSLRDDAYFELGNAYMQKGEDANALETFARLLQYHKNSSYVPKALLRQGLIYYNTGQDTKALDKYQQVVKTYPNTAEAKEAVTNARQIYIDLGRVDEYASWVKSLDFVAVSDSELEKDMYDSAEKQYLQNNLKKAIAAFKKYIEEFPKGQHAVQANFYLAESLYADNQKQEAEKYYASLSNLDRNEFTEQSLARLAQIYLDSQLWKKAIPVLEKLEDMADHTQNIIYAQSNLMKGHYELEHYDQAVTYAEKVLAHSKLDDKVRSDAKVIIARSAFKTGDEDKAQEAYEEVSAIATGELKAEALFYDAYFKNKEGNYKVSNSLIQKLVSDYAAYRYYGAKGLIVMAKNFYELKDAFQATYILENVINNFAERKDVTDEAKAELQRIKTEEAKTNESVNPDN
ncbi:MAG: tetratricopeptide repeat protein, partial [Flavobacteriaceae bacterium]|nr:tetratricopeptide repeat protein [Flavobacteriaceae bacterium]